MEISITCEQYARMTAIAKTVDPADKRKYLKSLFVERKNNHLYLVVTNIKLASITYLGANTGPDEETAIAIDETLIEACKKEIQFNSSLLIVANKALAFTNAKTTFGYIHPANLHVPLPEKHNFYAWRDWLPAEMPIASHGAMMWNADTIALLAQSAPSGVVRFPAFIDSRKPVLICDFEVDTWIGLFMSDMDDKSPIDPSEIPDWINK